MKFIRKLLFTIILIIIIICSIILLIGKNYYNKALKEKTLITKIDEVTGKENFVKFEDMSADYRNAVVSVEDHRFYDHGPVDFIAIGRAIFTNVKNKELQEGGSTITQQVAKNVIFSQDKSWVRKVGEIFASYDLEKNYNKKEIFELYVNTAYFGDGYYGIYDASYGYYNKSPKDLNLDEASMLAGVPNAPSVYAPTVNPNLAKKRQYHVLNKMNEYFETSFYEMYEKIDDETNEIILEYQPKIDEKIIRFVALTNSNNFPISREDIKDKYGIVSYKTNKLLEN